VTRTRTGRVGKRPWGSLCLAPWAGVQIAGKKSGEVQAEIYSAAGWAGESSFGHFLALVGEQTVMTDGGNSAIFTLGSYGGLPTLISRSLVIRSPESADPPVRITFPFAGPALIYIWLGSGGQM
jgi:hypothetical protein